MPKSRNTDQVSRYQNYRSLDLANKIYQVKTLRLISSFNLSSTRDPATAGPFILELGSADDSFLNLVIKKTNGTGIGLDLTKGNDLEKPLKIKSDSVDLVIALEIIEHLFNTDAFLSEIHRVLRPGGTLILSTPNLASLKNRLRLLFGKYPQYLEYSSAGAGHIHLYTPPILRSQIENCPDKIEDPRQSRDKLKIENFTSPNIPCPFITKSWFPNILKELFMFLGDLFPTLGSHILIVARKP